MDTAVINHPENDCYKRIAEEYIAKQARKQQSQKSNNNRNRNRNRERQQRASVYVANADNNENSPAYSSIFGGLAYCSKAAVNGRIRHVNGV